MYYYMYINAHEEDSARVTSDQVTTCIQTYSECTLKLRCAWLVGVNTHVVWATLKFLQTKDDTNTDLAVIKTAFFPQKEKISE